MGTVTFEGEAPFQMPAFHSATAYAVGTTVLVVMDVSVKGIAQPVQFQMTQPQGVEFVARLAKAVEDATPRR